MLAQCGAEFLQAPSIDAGDMLPGPTMMFSPRV